MSVEDPLPAVDGLTKVVSSNVQESPLKPQPPVKCIKKALPGAHEFTHQFEGNCE